MGRGAELRARRELGAAIGAATGPVAVFGQSWAGTGDARVHVWALAIVAGALLGALTWPIFQTDERPGSALFGALFGFAVGLVAGAFVAFPMGSAIGSLFGAIAGFVVVKLAKPLGAWPFGMALSSIAGAGVALLSAWWWFQ